MIHTKNQHNPPKASHKYMYHRAEDTAEVSILPITPCTYPLCMILTINSHYVVRSNNFPNTTYLPINAVPSGTAGYNFTQPTQ